MATLAVEAGRSPLAGRPFGLDSHVLQHGLESSLTVACVGMWCSTRKPPDRKFRLQNHGISEFGHCYKFGPLVCPDIDHSMS